MRPLVCWHAIRDKGAEGLGVPCHRDHHSQHHHHHPGLPLEIEVYPFPENTEVSVKKYTKIYENLCILPVDCFPFLMASFVQENYPLNVYICCI